MSELPQALDAMETSLDLLAWRDALADAAPVPSGADLADWARLLADAGYDAEAALLRDVAALHGGFSPQACADRDMSGGRPFGSAVPAADDDMTARAMAELRQLGHAIGATGIACASGRSDPAVVGPAGDIARIAGLLRRLLERPLGVEGEELAATLGALAMTARRMPAFDHRGFAQAPLTVLVPAIATVALVDFALRTRDLWEGPRGSPALMHRAARLDGAGLGPYLANVGRLARDSSDVFAMARVARDAAGSVEAPLEPWIALLARGCANDLLREVVDDLGDVGAGEALRAILGREASRPAPVVDLDLVMRLRDAGLDNADHGLAAHAQRVVARLRPDSELEGMILGAIEATRGRPGVAAATFRHWLARSPGNGEIRARLEALEADRFEPFAILRGFGSPADRQATRLRRRGILPDHPRRRGERIDAVEVR